MKNTVQVSPRSALALGCLMAVALLLAACVPVAPAPPAEMTTECAPAPWPECGCRAVMDQVIVVGDWEALQPIVYQDGVEILDAREGDEIWNYQKTLDADDVNPDNGKRIAFNAYYLLETDDIGKVMRQVDEVGGSASLNFHTFGTEHSGGDSPFGHFPHPVPKPKPGEAEIDILAQRALTDLLGVEASHGAGALGEGVTVGVFDTAPMPWSNFADLKHKIEASPGATGWYTAGLTVTNQSRDHGVFVSSLVNAVAPQANIELLRVLEDSGTGTTAQIFDQVLDFLLVHHPAEDVPVVLNFSLGISCAGEAPAGWPYPMPPFEALHRLLLGAYNDGAVIVAAAGNDSNRYSDPPFVRRSAFPAIAVYAIGVGATDMDTNPTCYTHKAEIYAPGGAGIQATQAITGYPEIPWASPPYCMPNHTSCTDLGCEFGVVGMSADSASGYAFWPGTSFATPLVSGLAARILSQGMAPWDVEDRIKTQPCTEERASGEFFLGDISACF